MAKLPDTPKNRASCFCANCPSYNDCAKQKKELLFCADEVGKSGCDFPMNGCMCGACPIHEQYKLRSGYYCIHGSATQVDK